MNDDDLQRIKSGMRATWMAGDFGQIARLMTGDAGRFADSLPLSPGSRVLDVACGTGNVSLPLARAGHQVTGVDIAPNLVEQARASAMEQHLEATFDEGDAEALPYADGSFDAAVTMFGAMFAPRPERVAAELARVVKPGGLLAMANWNPESFSGAMFRVGGKHVPPPPGVPPPVLWGDAETARLRLADGFAGIETELVPIEFRFPMPPAGTVELFRQYFGPMHVAFGRLDASGQQALRTNLETLWSGANVSAAPAAETLIHNEYLKVTARRR